MRIDFMDRILLSRTYDARFCGDVHTQRAALLPCGKGWLCEASWARGSQDDRQALRGAGDACVEPAVAMLAECAALVEKNDLIPLRTLRLVNGQRIAVVEFIRVFAQRIGNIVHAGKEFRDHADAQRFAAAVVFGHHCEAEFFPAYPAGSVDRPQRAVEQALLAVVLETD